MKKKLFSSFLALALLAFPARNALAQFTELYPFTGDGYSPVASLVLSSNVLYGTAEYGGDGGYGTVFAVNTDGTGFTTLYSFTNGDDGANPSAGLILSSNILYGTAEFGGSAGAGTVFAYDTTQPPGMGFTTLYGFTNSGDGVEPKAGLLLLCNTLYGTTEDGGNSGLGTVFAIKTDGSCFTNLHSFGYYEGAYPRGGLILSGCTFYGTTAGGGSFGNGAVYALKTDGSCVSNVYSFPNGNTAANPACGLVLSSNTLYGTTYGQGSSSYGMVFAVNTNGMCFTNLHSFDYSDGAQPVAGLVLSGNTLYGTTEDGGDGYGTLFAINTDGTGFTNLYSFTDGGEPEDGLILSGLTFYGTAQSGGYGYGEVFSYSLPCPTITLSPGTLADGEVSINYTQTITASGGVAPYTIALANGSSLPYPLNLSADGVLSGTPGYTGSFSFVVTATDADGCVATNSYVLNIGPSPFADLYNFTTLYGPAATNSYGAYPNAVILSGNTLYGTTQNGGSSGSGAVFAVNTDGSGLSNVYSFTATSSASYLGSNSDGAYPLAGLVLSGNILYGTARYGGASGFGTVFAVNTDGTGFTNLHSFSTISDSYPYGNSDGAYPQASLIISGNTLYGTAEEGGTSDAGAVFSVNTDGTCFTNLYNFTYYSDGAYPIAGLTLSGKTLYGTAESGGTGYAGTVFSINTNGRCFSNLYSFTGGSDGGGPDGTLILSGNALYGVASYGGISSNGAVFAVNTNGMCFTNLYSFSALNQNQFGQNTNIDGSGPDGGLLLSGNTLYGTASSGGVSSYGTAFAVNTDGTGFTTLYDFDYFDGANPNGPLVLSSNILYGTALYGGNMGYGLVFSLSACPIITLSPDGLPNGNVGNSYDQTFTASGGVAPYSFAVTGGSLPGGLSLAGGGVLSGAPTNIGSFSFTVIATDANGCANINSYVINIFAHFDLLYSFTNDSDGAYPYAGLVLSGNSLYGTVNNGGTGNGGTVFSVNTDGTGFTALHGFTGGNDGASPQAGLILSGNTLYGAAGVGGSGASGTVFALNNDGTGFRTVYSFTDGSDGAYPYARLLLSSNTLYGTDRESEPGFGNVFKVNTAGMPFALVHPFTDSGNDGAGPDHGLILSGNTLYGTTPAGGSSHFGMVFSVNTDGSGFTNLHSFTASSSDGAYPEAGLILSGGTLYGTTDNGGTSGLGTVFAVNTDGSGFRVVYSFTGESIITINGNEYLANNDGAYPGAGLVLSGNTLYGTSTSGGASGFGTAFAVNTDGTGFATLYNFSGGSDGGSPEDGLILVGNILYGTAVDGGSTDHGTIFALGLGGVNPAVPPVVTWNTPAPITYGAALSSNQLNATANVPGNFAYSPLPGIVLNDTGTYTLSVIFTPADTVHYSCLTNTVSLAVSRAPLVVTANNTSRQMGASNPIFTGTITGLVNGDSITAAYSCSADYDSLPGTFPIVPSLVDPDNRQTNYTVSLINGTLTVTPIVDIFNVVHSFTAGSRNSDGSVPLGGLIVSNNILYGTASTGGSFGNGTLFAVNTDGTGFTNLHDFSTASGCCGFFDNIDGVGPKGALVLSGNTLFGPAQFGGYGYVGTLFQVNTDGSGFAPLHEFPYVTVVDINNVDYFENSDGAYPYAGMIVSGDTLYGTAQEGGSSGTGTIFSAHTDNMNFSPLYSFTAHSGPNETNGDGMFPFAGLVLSGNTLYGVAQNGGTNGAGTVFAINTSNSVFTNLHSFVAASDGGAPDGALVLSGSTLYGTAGAGGSSGNGTVFAINTNGTGFRVLHNFSALNNNTNYDGVEPLAGLTLSADGATVYGTAISGGTSGYGTVFAINTNGTCFTNLYNFTDGPDGGGPESALVISDFSLYGTALGGPSGNGTIYSLTFLPQLAINLAPANIDETDVILSWPTNLVGFSFVGFTLQYTTNLSPADWHPVDDPRVVINGRYTVTTPARPTQSFYRLFEHLSQ